MLKPGSKSRAFPLISTVQQERERFVTVLFENLPRAIGGKIKELIKRSQTARDMMNFVVDCFRNLLFQRATIVHKLPNVPTMLNIESIIATKYATPLDTIIGSIFDKQTENW